MECLDKTRNEIHRHFIPTTCAGIERGKESAFDVEYDFISRLLNYRSTYLDADSVVVAIDTLALTFVFELLADDSLAFVYGLRTVGDEIAAAATNRLDGRLSPSDVRHRCVHLASSSAQSS